MADRADERTPLINNQQTRESSGVEQVRREFDEALEEEAPNTTLFDLLTKRPITVIIALTLFALFIIITSSIQSIDTAEWLDRAVDVADVAPGGFELVQIRNNEIEVKVEASLELDYKKLGNDSMLPSVAQFIGSKLGSVNLAFDGPITLYTRPYAAAEPEVESGPKSEPALEDDDWFYLISAHVPENVQVSLLPESKQDLEITLLLTDVGRSDVLGKLVHDSLKNTPVSMKAKGTSIVSKYGLSIRVPFVVTREIRLPKQTTNELAEVSKVKVTSESLHTIKMTALANASISDSVVSADLPSLNWKVKIPGCGGPGDPTSMEEACQGKSLPFSITQGDEIVNLYFQALIDQIPDKLTEPCSDSPFSKSPLDEFISRYLNGELSTFYVEGLADDHMPKILNDLLTGYSIPYTVFGKEAYEKLIQSITLKNVKFGNQIYQWGDTYLDMTSVSFSGKAIVDVVLPKFLEMKTKTAILVTGARGNIQLFDNEHTHFGQVLANRSREGESEEKSWLQTISLAGPDGYKVTCFFDNLPMEVTNNEVLASVSREIFLRGHAKIHYDAVVDVKFDTLVGQFVTKQVRIKGTTEMYA